MKSYLSSLLILLLSLLSLACQRSAEYYYNSALQHAHYRNFCFAVKHLNNAIKINPVFAEAYFERGKMNFQNCYRNKNNMTNNNYKIMKIKLDSAKNEIFNDFKIAENLDSSLTSNIHLNTGNIYFALDDLVSAINEYSITLQINPKEKEASINIFMAKTLVGEINDAFRVLDQMVEDDPYNAESYYIRAIMRLEDGGNNCQSCEDFKTALLLYDENKDYFYGSFIKGFNLKRDIEEFMKINCKENKTAT